MKLARNGDILNGCLQNASYSCTFCCSTGSCRPRTPGCCRCITLCTGSCAGKPCCTGLQVLKEPGRTSTSKSYMWLYQTSGRAEYPIVLYKYTSQAGRWSTRRPFSRTSPADCMQTATRGTTNCPRTSGWWVAGLIPGESLTRRCRRCPKRNGRILWRQPVSVAAPDCFSWSSLSWT